MSPSHASGRPRAATAVLIALSLLLGSLIAVASTAVRPAPAAAATGVCDVNEFSCWMGRLADVIGQRPLNQVVQPGSHDTGTYNIQNYGSLARNQDASVYDSLARGVRQFDLRAHERTLGGQTDLYAFHGSVDTDTKLSTMLDDVLRYTTSPGTDKEIIYLHINTDQKDGGQSLVNTCRTYGPQLAPLLLNDKLLYSGGQMRSMNEIWALPGSPRVIVDWTCPSGSTSVFTQSGSANGDYYANQGNTPCVKYAVTKALEGRWSGTDDAKRGQDVPYSFQQGNPCWNTGNVPAGSQAMTKLDTHVTGLYTLYIQQTGLVPSSALYVQRDVLSMLVDYWNNDVGTARGNLNYVSADYVLDGDTSLLTRTIGLNTRSIRPNITATFDTSNPDAGKWRYVYTCNTLAENNNARLVAWSSSETSTSPDAVQLSSAKLSLPLTGSYVLRCTDGAGRRARLVQANKLSPTGVVNQSVTADQQQLASPATVRLTDAYGKPMSGHSVTFGVSGAGRLSADGSTSSSAFTDADGLASTPVYLTHGIGRIAVTAAAITGMAASSGSNRAVTARAPHRSAGRCGCRRRDSPRRGRA